MANPRTKARFLLPFAALAIGILPASATQDPSRWTVSTLAGQAGSTWIANVTVRETDNAYAYRTQRQLLMINHATGCVDHREQLADTSFVDTDASGEWTLTSNQAEEGDFSLLVDVAPPVPGDWAHLLSMEDGGLYLTYDGATHLLVSSDRVTAWSNLQLGSASDELRLVDTYESVDAWRGDDDVVFVELETTERSIDIDYTRFIVPIRPLAAIDLLFEEPANASALTSTQPSPCNS